MTDPSDFLLGMLPSGVQKILLGLAVVSVSVVVIFVEFSGS
jgi:hypothetical protein